MTNNKFYSHPCFANLNFLCPTDNFRNVVGFDDVIFWSSVLGGPPPSYRSSTYADDSSTYSESSGAAFTSKRRNSWSNFVRNEESLYGAKKTDVLHTFSPCASPLTPYHQIYHGNVIGSYSRSNGFGYITESEKLKTVYHLENYNLNGPYSKYYTPFYSFSPSGDHCPDIHLPTAAAKFILKVCFFMLHCMSKHVALCN